MAKHVDITGQKFGRLTATKRLPKAPGQARPRYHCVCECGNTLELQARHLTSGHTKSCGCLQRDRSREAHLTHGRAHDHTYSAWAAMKARCLRKTSPKYRDYGGRGITVCERWMDFANFFADMGERPRDYAIERVNVNGNYCPENCKWIPAGLQADNQRRTHRITLNGVTRTRSEWSKETGIPYAVIAHRHRNGWSANEILGGH